jgi:hypothetical protein
MASGSPKLRRCGCRQRLWLCTRLDAASCPNRRSESPAGPRGPPSAATGRQAPNCRAAPHSPGCRRAHDAPRVGGRRGRHTGPWAAYPSPPAASANSNTVLHGPPRTASDDVRERGSAGDRGRGDVGLSASLADTPGTALLAASPGRMVAMRGARIRLLHPRSAPPRMAHPRRQPHGEPWCMTTTRRSGRASSARGRDLERAL